MLIGDEQKRTEVERHLKQKHDVSKPFPEEETTEQPGSSSAEPVMDLVAMGDYINEEGAEPIHVTPISIDRPMIVHWETVKFPETRGTWIRIKRADENLELYRNFHHFIRFCTRSELEEMFKVGMELYANVLQEEIPSDLKIILEWLCMMFSPDKVSEVLNKGGHCSEVTAWVLYENCGVHMLNIDGILIEYYLVERQYNFGSRRLHAMMLSKLRAMKNSQIAQELIRVMKAQWVNVVIR